MPLNNVEDITAALETTRVSAIGISFAGQSLKLDTEADAQPIIDAMNACPELNYLNLEGNTLGVEASKAIGGALEKHAEFKRALWKDLFTGRMKTEIPKALEFLGRGLVQAGARLVELDLSDNAFGPIGVEGLAALVRSPSCYALQELRLNNNGLGITGGKLLAAALTDCYQSSKSNENGKALALKVFIAGRNRLENDGAKALANVFKMIGTLEEIAMPQNGIYHVGISALCDAFTHNKNLQILNLNDNTIGVKGAEAIAKVLPNLQNLKEINFGDCLLKTKGAQFLGEALKVGHNDLVELNLGHNEIHKSGGLVVIDAMCNKSKLTNLILDGNCFGEAGRSELESKLKNIGKLNILSSLSEDESEESEDDEEAENEEDEEEETDDDDNDQNNKSQIIIQPKYEDPFGISSGIQQQHIIATANKVTIDEFLKTPSPDNFLALGESREDIILNEVKNNKTNLDTSVAILMKVASLSSGLSDNISNKMVANASLKCTELLFKELFSGPVDDQSLINNSILVNLGLIKSEDKKFKPTWNLEGCLYAVQVMVGKTFIPQSTKDVLKVFMQRQVN